jgi:membrane protease YdiL (CAAX protease family)
MAAPSSVAPLSPSRKLLAPCWHTIVLVLLVLGTSYFQSSRLGRLQNYNITNRMAVYSFTIFFELVLLAYVWFLGIRHTGTRFRDVIGGNWENAKDVWRDIGIAFLFWFVVAFFLVSISHLLGKNTEMTKVAEVIMPRGPLELAVWILLSISAGFCEEFVFRGYLQKQFFAFTGNLPAAIAGQALIFGVAHGYQGVKGMLTIAVYGALFGILANMRKSLRPGMIQHVMQDSSAGIFLSLSKYLAKPPS